MADISQQVAQMSSLQIKEEKLSETKKATLYIATKALQLLNFEPINGKPIRIMHSNRGPNIPKSGCANVFIRNLISSVDNKELYRMFARFGTVLSCKVAVDDNGNSKGFGFVQFDKEEEAQKAIEEMNRTLINDEQVYVGSFICNQDREMAKEAQLRATIYVKNLSEKVCETDLKSIFGQYGPITGATVARDENGVSKGFGYVIFEKSDAADSAVENLNGYSHDEKVWYVGWAQNKAGRQAELEAKFEQEKIDRMVKSKASNLYVKKLDENVDDEKLKELFSEFGTITSCKVMLDSEGKSKGFGFVAFSTPEEASQAVKEMKGKNIGKRKLYVGLAQSKEERKVSLRAARGIYQRRKVLLPIED